MPKTPKTQRVIRLYLEKGLPQNIYIGYNVPIHSRWWEKLIPAKLQDKPGVFSPEKEASAHE